MTATRKRVPSRIERTTVTFAWIATAWIALEVVGALLMHSWRPAATLVINVASMWITVTLYRQRNQARWERDVLRDVIVDALAGTSK